MAKKRNATRAGVFMVVSVALTVFVIIAVSGAGRFTQSFSTYPIAFSLKDNVAGLRPGDDVRIGGVRVGSVQEIQIVNKPVEAGEGRAILVFIEVPSKYTLGKDASVRVEKGLTGTAEINIEDLGTGPAITHGQYVRGKPDALLAFENKLSEIAPNLPPIVDNVKAASVKLNDDLTKFGQTADSFTETGHHATNTMDVVHDLIGPSTTDFHGTMANINTITTGLRDRMPALLEQASDMLKNINGDITKAGTALTDIQATVANTKDITGSAKSVIAGNKTKLDGMITSLKATSDNLKFASIEIRHSPWRLLYQPKEGEVANLNIYDSVRQFAEGANSLSDAAGALKDAMADKTANSSDIQKRVKELDDSFAHFQAVQQKLWSEVKE